MRVRQKKAWIVSIFMAIVVIIVGIFVSDTIQHNIQAASLITHINMLEQIPQATNAQCPTDASKLISIQREISGKETVMVAQMDKMPKMPNMANMSSMPHSEHSIIALKVSKYSRNLHTCIAEIKETITKNNNVVATEQIYFSANDQILAQYSNPDTYIIIPIKNNGSIIKKFTVNDWLKYETSIGLP
jgi:hypothetical protein